MVDAKNLTAGENDLNVKRVNAMKTGGEKEEEELKGGGSRIYTQTLNFE